MSSTTKTYMKDGTVIKVHQFPGGVYSVERSNVGDPRVLDSCEMKLDDMMATVEMYKQSGYVEV